MEVKSFEALLFSSAPVVFLGSALFLKQNKSLLRSDFQERDAVLFAVASTLFPFTVLHLQATGIQSTLAWFLLTAFKVSSVVTSLLLISQSRVLFPAAQVEWLNKPEIDRALSLFIYSCLLSVLQDSFLQQSLQRSDTFMNFYPIVKFPPVPTRLLSLVYLLLHSVLITVVGVYGTKQGEMIRNEVRTRSTSFYLGAMRRYAFEKQRLVERRRVLKEWAEFEINHPDGRINDFIERFVRMKKANVECGACLTKKTSKRVPRFGSCEHRMCIPCTQHYILECCNSPDGTNLECPYEPQRCPFLGKNVVDAVLLRNDLRINGEDIRKKLEKAYIRAGLLDLQNVMVCPSPDCVNATFSGERLVQENFYELRKKAAEEGVKKTIKKKIVSSTGKPKWRKEGKTWTAALNTEVSAQVIEEPVPVIYYKTFKVSEGGVDLRKFKCELCNYSSCVVCKKPWTYGVAEHKQLTCEEYHDVALFNEENPEEALTNREIMEMKRGLRAKECPQCHVLIEKNEGCKHMTCSRCKHQYCWICLGVYGQCNC